jgi:crotonobetainyl-CoA:carnitine CoA-transferase CaiB-like acyl-CoA transferase
MRALSGLRVLEFSAGPGAAFGGRLLSMQNAQVTRLVDIRTATATDDAADVYLDMGKSRVSLDLSTAKDRRALDVLLDETDVFITDHDVRVLERAGLHWQTLRLERPRLVYAAISVFGASGPRADWIGTDLEAQALGGLMSQIGRPTEAPIAIPYSAAMMHAGTHAAGALLAAILRRSVTGHGSFVDIAAAQTVAASVRNYSLLLRYYNIPLTRAGNRAPGSLGRYPVAIFPCSDGNVVMTARSGQQWRAIVEMMGSPDWAKLPRYQNTLGMSIEYPEEVDALIIPWTLKHTRAELGALAIKYKVPLGPVRRLDELLDDEQFLSRDFFVDVEAQGRKIKLPRDPFRWTQS